jgi:hypothetical protein
MDDRSLPRAVRQAEAGTVLELQRMTAKSLKTEFEKQLRHPTLQACVPENIPEEVFDILLKWIPTRSLPPTITDEVFNTRKYDVRLDSREAAEGIIANEQKNLTYLWMVANMSGWKLPSLQNEIIAELIRIHKKSPDISQEVLRPVTEKTAPGSPLRRLYVDICARDLDMRECDNGLGYYPKKFMAEFMAIREQREEEKMGNKPLKSSDYYVGLGNNGPWM